MPHSPTELRDIHAAFGTDEVLVERRRAMYAAVVELVTGESADILADLIDSPAVRAHLGEVILGGRRAYRPDLMTPLSRLVVGAPEFVIGKWRTAVVSDPSARLPLEGAVRTIAAELGGGDSEVRLLLDGDPGFDSARRIVLDGLELVSELCPALAADLLPHVALFAIVAQGDRPGALGSASVREYPGLIVVPQPESAVEVAEALVHEGAHQKFFDLGVTRSIFDADFCRAPFFRASWSPGTGSRWPLEQCLAAFHAYTCLAAFYASVRTHAPALRLHDFSLLPVACSRADELGAWMRENVAFLGPDGRHLVRMLAGDAVPLAYEPAREMALPKTDRAVVKGCGAWTLVARMGESVELYWVRSDESLLRSTA